MINFLLLITCKSKSVLRIPSDCLDHRLFSIILAVAANLGAVIKNAHRKHHNAAMHLELGISVQRVYCQESNMT